MKTILIVITFLFSAYGLGGEKITVTGRVTDEGGAGIAGVNILEKGTINGAISDIDGYYSIDVTDEKAILVFSFVGYETIEKRIDKSGLINIVLTQDLTVLQDVVVSGYAAEAEVHELSSAVHVVGKKRHRANNYNPPSNEEYSPVNEEGYLTPGKHPLSTFSIDVDAASYANVRRYLNNGQNPPADAVRIEEMVNYFNYSYPSPRGDVPFSITTEVSDSPWNKGHKLVHIGLQGERIELDDLPASNLVFLLDVSGSMNSSDKLPLLKSSLKMLTNQLREEDRVSIVVYAGAAGVVLEPTSDKAAIIGALERLNAGGSTAGGAGIELAYQLAEREFDTKKNNRVILATDGDFNVGISDVKALERLIEQKRESGIYLTVLGFGTGNIKDNRMETLADKGNGNYSYIDSILEAKKVLVEEMGGTLLTIAKDVKIQVEFNPANVQAYRLIGYENRRLNDEDFNDDRKDAGELGAGHSVTALYEIIPAGVKSEAYSIDPLKYQTNTTPGQQLGEELLTVKLRYKEPGKSKSKLITQVVENTTVELSNASENMRWSAVVAGFGMYLRNSPYLGVQFNLEQNIMMAKSSRGLDENGYRAEFIRLMEVQNNL